MVEWNVQALPDGGHRVFRRDHETGDWSMPGTFPAEVALDDIVAQITEQADDCDYILLPDGSLVVILDQPAPRAT